MKTTKDMVDEDWERLALLDQIYVQEDLYRQEEEEKYAKLILGKPKKQGKFDGKYGRVTTIRIPERINI